MPKGDVDGPLERSLALGMVAAGARGRVAAQQASGSLPWVGVEDPLEMQCLQAEHTAKMQRVSNFQLRGPEELAGADDARHALQKERKPGGSLVHGWW